jgi:hypothetical protein
MPVNVFVAKKELDELKKSWEMRVEYEPYLKSLQEPWTDDEEQMMINRAMHNFALLFFHIAIKRYETILMKKALSNGGQPIPNSCLEPMILLPRPLLVTLKRSHFPLFASIPKKTQCQDDRHPGNDEISYGEG